LTFGHRFFRNVVGCVRSLGIGIVFLIGAVAVMGLLVVILSGFVYAWYIGVGLTLAAIGLFSVIKTLAFDQEV
jgi:hypothetical protein